MPAADDVPQTSRVRIGDVVRVASGNFLEMYDFMVFGYFAGAIGALGGVGINLALRQSYLSSGSASTAFWIFLAFYVLASAVTWFRYVRRPAATGVTMVPTDRHASAMAG